MSYIETGIIVIAIILIVLWVTDYNRYRTLGHPKKRATAVTENPTFFGRKEKLVPFDGLPNGEIYDTVEQTSSASKCADLCINDPMCDSFAYHSVDGLCQKRRNTESKGSAIYWKSKGRLIKVPGKALKSDLMREQTVNNADECSKVCMTDATCSVADFNESTSMCRTGSVLAAADVVSGVIPSRRTAIDLASN